ncbi:tetratricopeptide repeat protein [Clostridium acetireducens DSM 10703]|uniref:Tetratricopeptide repeat protein n=1 Tax=Clostridium acetireducens DSM 10703 TaxID=1121290 RepID=A0A1E8F088_9CLOT|nr:tetratricopeptide repeat protein [Clostridium acetireducens]OFI06850.1 tetratricopeptide repeat protein [Clostridium acetireducens DSM 10703]
MDKSSKIYSKALRAYNNGYIDKALDICEKSIGYNIKNSAAINLKGLLYYIKGDLITAQKLWKMNYNLNKDSIAKKYLEDTKNDEENFKLYLKAVKLIKNHKINEAIIILKECNKSDYNCVNINNYIAICYIKIGKYKEASKHLNKVLNIDKKNTMALNSYKALKSYGIKVYKPRKKYIIIIVFIIITIISVFVYRNLYAKKLSFNIGINKNKSINSNYKISKIKYKKPKKEIFPYQDIQKCIKNKDYNKIFDYISYWRNKDLSINDKYLLSQAEKIMEHEGVEYFYNLSTDYMNKGDFKKSTVFLLKAYEYGKNNYLYPHIVYTLGNCFQNIGNIESSLVYYEEYIKKFENGDYADIVLYNLSLIYSNINKNKSKEYAKRLIEKYPESMYNNSNIRAIVNN